MKDSENGVTYSGDKTIIKMTFHLTTKQRKSMLLVMGIGFLLVVIYFFINFMLSNLTLPVLTLIYVSLMSLILLELILGTSFTIKNEGVTKKQLLIGLIGSCVIILLIVVYLGISDFLFNTLGDIGLFLPLFGIIAVSLIAIFVVVYREHKKYAWLNKATPKAPLMDKKSQKILIGVCVFMVIMLLAVFIIAEVIMNDFNSEWDWIIFSSC